VAQREKGYLVTEETRNSRLATPPLFLVVLWLATALLIGLTIFRAVNAIATLGGLNSPSQTWIASAVDLANGVFYRPLCDEEHGYGGTRYFPLCFAVHAGLIKLGLDPIVAGHTCGIASTLCLIAGVYLLLRRLGVSVALALPSAGLVLASTSSQLAVITIRGDSLPAALCVFGLLACAQKKPKIAVAALLFTLAVAAKVTAVYGVIAAGAALALAGQPRKALTLTLSTSVGIMLCLVVMYLASGGRVFGIFRACALGGGGPLTFLRSPFSLVRNAVNDDPMGLPFLILSSSALISTFTASWRDLPCLAFLSIAAILGMIMASPGMDYNHLIDLHVMSIVVLVVAISRGRLPAHFLTIAIALSAIAACAAYKPAINTRRWHDIVNKVKDLRQPLFSEQPLVPLLAGERPYVLDPFMLAVVRKRDPRITADLWRKLETHKFGAVIVTERSLEERRFGDGFTERLNRHYDCATKCDGLS
jgi:hypothetical protein